MHCAVLRALCAGLLFKEKIALCISLTDWIFGLLNTDEFKILYKTYVRPHMEFCIQAWSPYLQKDTKCLENIQRRATKMVHGLKDIAYEDRLKILGLISIFH